jgi:hypothetical protein
MFGDAPRIRTELKALCRRLPCHSAIASLLLVLSVTNRTDALPLTGRLLCQLSYDSVITSHGRSARLRSWDLRVMSPLLCLLSYRTENLAPPAGFEPASARVEAACSDSVELQGHGATPAIRTQKPSGLGGRGIPFPSASRYCWCASSDSNGDAARFELARFAGYLQKRRDYMVDAACVCCAISIRSISLRI